MVKKQSLVCIKKKKNNKQPTDLNIGEIFVNFLWIANIFFPLLSVQFFIFLSEAQKASQNDICDFPPITEK